MGQVTEIGAELSRTLQVDPANLVGEAWMERLHPEDRAGVLPRLDAARRSGEGATLRLAAAPDGANFRWFEARLHDEADGSVVAEMRDVTEARDAEHRLERLRVEAAAALSTRDRLLANVSHELRTPLNAILGFSEILADPRLAPASVERRSEYARIVRASAQHLLSVVNLLLDVSKLEAGGYELAPEPFAVAALVGGCVDMVRLKAEEGGVAIAVGGAAASRELVADKRAFRQILLNLLSNAVKFTPPGGRVSVEIEADAGALRLTVADTGIGIAAEHLPRLGDPFFQARSGRDGATDGAGLGLALVRGLVGLHGGAVAIESAPGLGTRVTVRLPLDGRAPPAARQPAAKIEILAGLKPGAPVAIKELQIA